MIFYSLGVFFHQVFVCTSNRHKIAFYLIIGTAACGREVTALLHSLSSVNRVQNLVQFATGVKQ